MNVKNLSETVLHTMKECLLVLDGLHLKILRANEHFYYKFQTNREQVEHKSVYEILAGQWNTTCLKQALEKELPQKKEFRDVELKFFSPALGERMMLLSGSYFREPDQEQCILLLAYDITEVKRRDEIIHKREVELNSLAENSQAIIVHYNQQGRIIYANPGIERIAGRSVDFYLGKTDAELISVHGSTKEALECLQQVFHTGERLTTELTFGSPPGEQYYRTFFIPEFSRTGNVVRVLKIMHDITGLRKLNLELKNAQDRIFQILESISDGFLVLDKNWRFTYVNSAAARLVGLKPEDLLGNIIWDEFPILREKGYDCYYFEAMQKRITSEFEMTHPLSGEGWFNIRIYPSEEGLSVYWSDITAKKQAEEILKRDNKALERLVAERTRAWEVTQEELHRAKRLADLGALSAIVAHELRNPLSAIELASYNLQRKSKRQEQSLATHFHTIEKKIQESNQIIDNLLYYTRLRPAVLQEIDLYAVIRECEQAVKNRAKKPAVVLNNHTAAHKHLMLRADPTQLKEALLNILNNAYDALDSHGTIDVYVSEEDRYINVIIRDNGPGIDQAIIGKVMEPFFTTKTKGTGLGLAVAKQIAENHHGTLEITSTKGRGTTVNIKLARQ